MTSHSPQVLLVEASAFGRRRDATWRSEALATSPGTLAAARFQHLVACELRTLIAQDSPEPLRSIGVEGRTAELAALVDISPHTLRRKLRGEQPLKLVELGALLVELGAGSLPDLTAELLPPPWRLDNWHGGPLGTLRITLPTALTTVGIAELRSLTAGRLTIDSGTRTDSHHTTALALTVIDAPGSAGRDDLTRAISSIRSRIDALFKGPSKRESLVTWEPTSRPSG